MLYKTISREHERQKILMIFIELKEIAEYNLNKPVDN